MKIIKQIKSSFIFFIFPLSLLCFSAFSFSQEIISLGPDGKELIGQNEAPVMSRDGRYIAFQSSVQIYLKDTLSGALSLISETQKHAPGDQSSSHPQVSASGQFVSFESLATDFEPGAMSEQIYLKNTLSHELTLISKNKNQQAGNFYSNFPVLSPNGDTVYFQSNASNLIPEGDRVYRIYSKNTNTQEIKMLSSTTGSIPSNAAALHASLDPSGKFLLFESSSSNLDPNTIVPGYQLYRKDLSSGEIRLVSSNEEGKSISGNSAQGSMSADANLIAFSSNAHFRPNASGNQIYLKDMRTQKIFLISQDEEGVIGDGFSEFPKISEDGTKITFLSGSTQWKQGAHDGLKHLYQKNMISGVLTWIQPLLTLGVPERIIGSFDTNGEANLITFANESGFGSQIWKIKLPDQLNEGTKEY